MKQRWWLWFFLLITLIISGCEDLLVEGDHSVAPASGELLVHFIDVDQGDATLLEGPDFTVLIDTGRHDRDDVVPYLERRGVEKIDLLIGTHPHADHIGQMVQVLERFPVEEVWMSGESHTTQTFQQTIDAILAAEVDYYEPRAGETFQVGSLLIEVIHPEELNGDLDDASIGMRITYGDVAFLFTGDASQTAEQEMIERGHELRAHILHLGHHGSSTSTGEEFVRAVQPELAIYSAGRENSYGHPHREVVERLSSLEIPLLGTAQLGTIIVRTDGTKLEIESERSG